jgi:putative transposase
MVSEMLLTEKLKLAPTQRQRRSLLKTLRVCNAAANRVAEIAFEHKTSNKFQVHHLAYSTIRDDFGLPAQMAVRAIAKACGAYKRDKRIKPEFRRYGAIEYDQRILKTGKRIVSILTVDGREHVRVRNQPRHSGALHGAADLIYRDGNFYLAVVIEVPDEPLNETGDWLGVDLGIVNIATDSDGTEYSGKALRNIRRRNLALRTKLQAKGTKSARRLLKKRRRKESRMARDINHCISKQLVGKAKGTGRGIALEDLKGIRDRITVRKAQRADLHSWSFNQLRTFVAYKATIAGVPVRLVDPKNTSRTCPECNNIDKRNRPTRDEFCCVTCGFAGPADTIAARNISGRAAVMPPNAA